MLALLVLVGCIAPTTYGLRTDGYSGAPGAFEVGASASMFAVDLTAGGTVTDRTELAGAIGWKTGSVAHGELEVRAFGSPTFDKPGAQLILGAGAIADASGEGGWVGPYIGGLYGGPVGNYVRLYIGGKVNPSKGFGGGNYASAVFLEPTAGLTVRFGDERINGHLGLEIIGLMRFTKDGPGVFPFLQVFGAFGQGRPPGAGRSK